MFSRGLKYFNFNGSVKAVESLIDQLRKKEKPSFFIPHLGKHNNQKTKTSNN